MTCGWMTTGSAHRAATGSCATSRLPKCSYLRQLALLGPAARATCTPMMEAARRGDLTSARSAFAQLRTTSCEDGCDAANFRICRLLED